MDFLIAFVSQTASTVGVIFIFGFIIALLRRAFCAVTPMLGPKILLATGIVGTPIHELSHALMCLLFGHHITEIKLYQPKSNDGTLGYVKHTYNKRNIYHQMGNFFIGIAPVLLGGGIIILFMLMLIPDTAELVNLEIKLYSIKDTASIPIAEYFEFLVNTVKSIFSAGNLASWQGWLFIVLAIMTSTHMEMSGADIKSGLKGLFFVLLMLVLVDGIIYIIKPEALADISEAAFSFGLMLSAFLSISVLFLTSLLAVALVFKCIGMIFKR